MNAQCSKCGRILGLSWSYCPHCGLAVSREHQGEAPAEQPVEHEKSSMPGAFSGLLFGVITAPVLIIFGTLLCLTGLGAFLGIPMIIAAIVAPLAGPLLGMGEHEVRCPCCNTRMITVADGKLHCCPSCEKEFALGEHHVVTAG